MNKTTPSIPRLNLKTITLPPIVTKYTLQSQQSSESEETDSIIKHQFDNPQLEGSSKHSLPEYKTYDKFCEGLTSFISLHSEKKSYDAKNIIYYTGLFLNSLQSIINNDKHVNSSLKVRCDLVVKNIKILLQKFFTNLDDGWSVLCGRSTFSNTISKQIGNLALTSVNSGQVELYNAIVCFSELLLLLLTVTQKFSSNKPVETTINDNNEKSQIFITYTSIDSDKHSQKPFHKKALSKDFLTKEQGEALSPNLTVKYNNGYGITQIPQNKKKKPHVRFLKSSPQSFSKIKAVQAK